MQRNDDALGVSEIPVLEIFHRMEIFLNRLKRLSSFDATFGGRDGTPIAGRRSSRQCFGHCPHAMSTAKICQGINVVS